MHAVVVQVTVHDPDPDTARLRDEIVPRVSQAPGFVTGYWLRTGDDKGLSVIVFESEDAAQGAVEMIQAAAHPTRSPWTASTSERSWRTPEGNRGTRAAVRTTRDDRPQGSSPPPAFISARGAVGYAGRGRVVHRRNVPLCPCLRRPSAIPSSRSSTRSTSSSRTSPRCGSVPLLLALAAVHRLPDAAGARELQHPARRLPDRAVRVPLRSGAPTSPAMASTP